MLKWWMVCFRICQSIYSPNVVNGLFESLCWSMYDLKIVMFFFRVYVGACMALIWWNYSWSLVPVLMRSRQCLRGWEEEESWVALLMASCLIDVLHSFSLSSLSLVSGILWYSPWVYMYLKVDMTNFYRLALCNLVLRLSDILLNSKLFKLWMSNDDMTIIDHRGIVSKAYIGIYSSYMYCSHCSYILTIYELLCLSCHFSAFWSYAIFGRHTLWIAYFLKLKW